MEKYQGVKFCYRRRSNSFARTDARLTILNRWAYLFFQLGLTPVHAKGAYGNQSYRTGQSSFFITKSGMVPTEELNEDNFCHVIDFEQATNTFITEGQSIPSSESLLHNLLYQSQPHMNAILHGHSALFLKYAAALNIPTTKTFHQYGSRELAESAVELMDGVTQIFILKNHGFVVLGKNIEEAGNLTLDTLSQLIMILRTN
jgi:ribulose-5-phosphate 4-epimerase/fuculose-1-phosphate aldolase